MPLFAALFLLARGLPTWLLARAALPSRERSALALFTASALPLVVAMTLAFPLVATALLRR